MTVEKKIQQSIYMNVKAAVVILNAQVYHDIIKPGRPEVNQDMMEETAKEIRNIIKERRQIQDILQSTNE